MERRTFLRSPRVLRSASFTSDTLIVALVLGGCMSRTYWVKKECTSCLYSDRYPISPNQGLDQAFCRGSWTPRGDGPDWCANYPRPSPPCTTDREFEICMEDKGYERHVHWCLPPCGMGPW